MDITDTLAPKSDQLDAVDLLGGPQTFTITGVSRNADGEQPVNITLAEFPRIWRPGKSMRRVMAALWGPETKVWETRRVTLYCDPDVKFGGEVVGGTRISHMSHIGKKPRAVPLLVTKGRSATFRVQPLPDEPTLDERLASLRAEWDLVPEKSPRREEIRAEVTRLRGGPAPAPAPAPVEEPAADVVVPEEGPAYNARTGEVVDPGPDVDVQDPPPYDPAQEPAGWAVQS
jgi:hypothetical protein